MQRRQRGVVILRPLVVTAIEWEDRDYGEEPVAIRVHLTYELEQTPESRVRSGEPLEVFPSLAFHDRQILWRFIALGVDAKTAGKLLDLCENPKENDPIVLRAGILVDLLSLGITPSEVWVFILNHGAARTSARAIANLKGDIVRVRLYDPWKSARGKRELVRRAIRHCEQTAKTLQRLQSADMSAALAEIGCAKRIEPSGRLAAPHSALAPELAERVIADLRCIADYLKQYISADKQSAHRPADSDAIAFCRDWHRLAKERAGRPLYEAGAELYSLVFSKATPASFERMCRRARERVPQASRAPIS